MRKFLSRLVGISESSDLRSLEPLVAQINELESHYAELSDDQIRAEMLEIRDEVRAAAPANGKVARVLLPRRSAGTARS